MLSLIACVDTGFDTVSTKAVRECAARSFGVCGEWFETINFLMKAHGCTIRIKGN